MKCVRTEPRSLLNARWEERIYIRENLKLLAYVVEVIKYLLGSDAVVHPFVILGQVEFERVVENMRRFMHLAVAIH